MCHLGPAGVPGGAARAARWCAATGARVSLVAPVVDAAVPRGCCGIQGEQWRRIVDEDTRASLQAAAAELAAAGCPPGDVAVEVGAALEDAAEAAAERLGCDRVLIAAKPRPWSMGGPSRSQLRALRERFGGRLVTV